MNRSTLLASAEDFVSKLLLSKSQPGLLYHDYTHTVEVVEGAKMLSSSYELSPEEFDVLLLAAWFHDTGYTQQSEGHEAISIALATEFLKSAHVEQNRIDLVAACIRATASGVEPQGLLQELLKDADLLHLGTEEFFEKSELLRGEKSFLQGDNISELDWLNEEVEFLKTHVYYTKAAHLKFNHQKSKNLLKRRKEIEKLRQKALVVKEEMANEMGKKKNKEVPQRGVETMFRVTLKNHISISAIADNKANFMLTINALIISISVSTLLANYQEYNGLLWPTGFLLIVCLTTIIFATLSTSPKITKGTFTKEDVEKKKANLLFFGNFHESKLADFEWGMGEMMKDNDFLYGAMIRDLHSLGGVLAKKFWFLRMAYMVFMYGMILTVLFYIIGLSFL
jgi:HD superfamily phosphodiesterase